MSDNNNELIHPELQLDSSPSPSLVDEAANPLEDCASNSGASLGNASLTVEEVEAELNAIFGDDFSDEFKEACQDLFARAVQAQTADLEEQLAEAEANAFVLAEQVLTQARELVFQECLQGLPMTDRERLRERVQHIELDGDADTFKAQLLNEKRRMLPYTSTYGSSDALHEIHDEDYCDQPAQPKLIQEAMAAITKFHY